MYFTEAIRWLVSARDFAYNRRPEDQRDLTLAKYQWGEVARVAKEAIIANDEDADSLKIPIGEIEKNQMALMYLSAQALVPYCTSMNSPESPRDSRPLDLFNEVARVYENAGKKSPLQRRILGVNFFVKDYKIRADKKTAMASDFSTKDHVTTFERTLYLSFVLQACKKTQIRGNNYRFSRTNQEHCQRLGVMIGLIVEAFNRLAATCEYESIEQMSAPFIIWDASSFKFDPIMVSDNGFAPNYQSYCLTRPASPTRDPNLVDSSILSLTADKDEKLRNVAMEFFKELSVCVLDDNLVAQTWDSQYAKGSAYFLQNEESSISPRLMPLRRSIQEQFPVPPAVLQEWENCEQTNGDTSTGTDEQSLRQPEPPSQPVQAAQSTGEVARHVEEVRHRPIVSTAVRSGLLEEGIGAKRDQESTPTQTPDVPETVSTEIRDLVMRDTQTTVPVRKSLGRAQRLRQLQPTPLTQNELEVENKMKPFIDMYNCNFRDFISRYNERHDTSRTDIAAHPLLGKVQLLLTDPPYGIRASSGRANSDYDTISVSDMEHVINMSGDLLRPGGHGIIFCSFQQYNAWRILILEKKNEEGNPLYSVSPVPYNLLNVPGRKRSGNSRTSVLLKTTGEIAVHFVRRGLDQDSQIAMIDYEASEDVPSRFPGYSNTIDNIPDLERGEQLRFNGRALRNEQKSLYLIRELIVKHSKRGDIVADLFSGTFTTAAGCISVPKGTHRVFVGCELSRTAFMVAKRRLITSFAKLVLVDDISLEEQNKPSIAALRGIVFTSLRNRPDEWKPLEGFPFSTRFPPDTVAYLARLLGDKSIEMLTTLVPEQWPVRIQERLLSVPIHVLRAYECITSSVYVAKSTVKHQSAGQGLFASRHLRKNTVIGYYYGTLVYENMLAKTNATRVYGNRLGLVTKKSFKKFAITLQVDNEKLGLPSRKEIFLIPSEYNVFRFVNDCRYLEGDDEKDGTGLRRKQNVQFWQPDVIQNLESLRSPHTIKVRVLENIEANAELFIDYGPEYAFPVAPRRNEPVLAGKRRRIEK